jgi:citrate lyase subunit beta/citryl-CoA lyase
LPVWRSLLFVQVTARRFVDGAARRGADAIILDLEDSVAASEKERARTLVPEAAEIVSRGGADVVVRINRPLRLAVRDIEAVVGPRVLALGLPKIDSAEHVRLIAEIVDEVEAERGVASGDDAVDRDGRDRRGLLPPRRDRTRPLRLCALNLGAEDFATSAGIAPDAEALSTPKQTAVIAARAGGLHRLDCRVQRSRRVSLDDSPLAPRRLHRRLGHLPEPSADSERRVPAAPRRGRPCSARRRCL